MKERPYRTYMSEPLNDGARFTNSDRSREQGRTLGDLLGDLATMSANREDFA
ncbi:MAG: hypothetical protein VXY14_04550 [Candidatus Thermoplasmatota archaeon]|nr:hypothetical protein [Candidatus Thermoplasmatota archaeon]